MLKSTIAGILSLTIVACSPSRQNSVTSKSPQFDKQAHRGGRGLMPENTIPAMLNAIDLGVTTLEMDVVISNDYQVVVSHDTYFNENITTTPSGKFLTKQEASGRVLYSMTYDSIRKYDVGLKPYPDFPQQKKIKAVKPLLTDLLDATEAYAKEKGVQIFYNIEIKSKPADDGKKHPPVREFTTLVMDLLIKKGTITRTTIQSFDPRGLQIIHSEYPDTKLSLLVSDTDKRTLDQQIQQLGFVPAVYSPHSLLVTSALVKECHAKKIQVIPWTVNTIEGVKQLQQLGVDGVISDYPNLFQHL